ncbi:MAG: hypothetical protein RRY40_06045 [Oscillospiraceae bacterium]
MKKTDTAMVSFIMAGILTLFRVPLKLFNISPDTGFFYRGNILGITFNIVFFCSLLVGAIYVFANREDFKLPLRTGLIRSAAAFLTGTVTAAISAFKLFCEPYAVSNSPNAIPPMLSVGGDILGIAAGAALIFMALSVFSGNSCKLGEFASLILPCWCALSMLCDFMNFRFVLTASDQLMQTIFMLSSTMFFLRLSKEIIYKTGNTIGFILPGVLTVITGFPLALAQLAALMLVGDFISGPSCLETIEILTISIFAFVLLLSPIKKRDPRLGEKPEE